MRRVIGVVSLLALLVSVARAEDQVHWQPSLEAAQQLAAKTNRLVLIHFWAPWCGPCMNMEKNVFTQPEVGPALDVNFVPVKLNADDSRATARIYQVNSLPTDVIVTPSGRLIAALQSPASASQYVTQLNQVADNYRQGAQAGFAVGRGDASAQNPYGAVQAAGAQNAGPPAQPYGAQQSVAPPGQQFGPPGGQPAGAPLAQQAGAPGQPLDNRPVNYPPQGPPAVAPALPGVAQVSMAPPVAPPATAQALDGLDGFCPVTLVERKRWVKGDVRFGAIHRNRVYKFVSQEAQQRFLANPDAFSPVLQGCDPVLALDAHQQVPGTREHGLFYEKRIYLFSSEDSLMRFQASPKRYAAEVIQAMR